MLLEQRCDVPREGARDVPAHALGVEPLPPFLRPHAEQRGEVVRQDLVDLGECRAEHLPRRALEGEQQEPAEVPVGAGQPTDRRRRPRGRGLLEPGEGRDGDARGPRPRLVEADGYEVVCRQAELLERVHRLDELVVREQRRARRRHEPEPADETLLGRPQPPLRLRTPLARRAVAQLRDQSSQRPGAPEGVAARRRIPTIAQPKRPRSRSPKIPYATSPTSAHPPAIVERSSAPRAVKSTSGRAARDGAPWAATSVANTREFVASRVGCNVYQPAYGAMSLAAACLKAAPTTEAPQVRGFRFERRQQSYARTANASTSTRGRPLVPSTTSFIVCAPLAEKRHPLTTFCVVIVAEYRSRRPMS